MKKIYFAGTFELIEDASLTLPERLTNDYRAQILGNSELMVNYNPHLIIDKYHYVGPFYCEEAVPGKYTSTDCEVVVKQERLQVECCDLFVCVFTEWLSIGTVVELEWAIHLNKEIILYNQICENDEYNLPSGLWFAIQDAMQRGRIIKILPFSEYDMMVCNIKQLLKRIV